MLEHRNAVLSRRPSWMPRSLGSVRQELYLRFPGAIAVTERLAEQSTAITAAFAGARRRETAARHCEREAWQTRWLQRHRAELAASAGRGL